MQAANELLREGFFGFATTSAAAAGWPAGCKSITVIVGNPEGLRAGKRCVCLQHYTTSVGSSMLVAVLIVQPCHITLWSPDGAGVSTAI